MFSVAYLLEAFSESIKTSPGDAGPKGQRESLGSVLL